MRCLPYNKGVKNDQNAYSQYLSKFLSSSHMYDSVRQVDGLNQWTKRSEFQKIVIKRSFKNEQWNKIIKLRKNLFYKKSEGIQCRKLWRELERIPKIAQDRGGYPVFLKCLDFTLVHEICPASIQETLLVGWLNLASISWTGWRKQYFWAAFWVNILHWLQIKLATFKIDINSLISL